MHAEIVGNSPAGLSGWYYILKGLPMNDKGVVEYVFSPVTKLGDKYESDNSRPIKGLTDATLDSSGLASDKITALRSSRGFSWYGGRRATRKSTKKTRKNRRQRRRYSRRH